MKISKSSPDAHNLFNYEVQALHYLKLNFNDELKNHISVIETAFFYANHAIIILDLLGPSLYEELKRHNFNGFPLKYIQKVFQSILPVLNTLSSFQLIHCDVKPENILLCHKNDSCNESNDNKDSLNTNKNNIHLSKDNDNSSESKSSSLSSSLILEISPSSDDVQYNVEPQTISGSKVGSYSYALNTKNKNDFQFECNNENQKLNNNDNDTSLPQNTTQNEIKTTSSYDDISFKLIDFGSCLFIGDIQDYIQSRYYRAPEILLRLPYDSKIDVWSLGCLAVELMLGVPILPAQTELHLATLIERTIGPFPRHMFENSPRSTQIFMPDGKVKPASLLCEENGEDFATTFKPYFVKKKLKKIIMSYESNQPGNDLRDREVFVDLVQKMLAVDPEERFSAADALNHPFLHMDFH
ncbi:hypothetical protein M9Y10_033755 [Tritrichomonas musculus]|uniref:Protein kinase domain-containing protein n=1 Tax=Tritrichomonas musculus TaxID=1915356 RepID=A0ABR2KD01_9EUKA